MKTQLIAYFSALFSTIFTEIKTFFRRPFHYHLTLEKRKRKLYWAGMMLLGLFLLFILLDLLFPLPPLKPYSQVVYAEDGSLECAYLSEDDKWRLKTNPEEINPDMKRAIIVKEDTWFYWHLGVNPIALGRAFFQNLLSQKRVSGASTITMQLARLCEPKKRNYASKISEIFRAFQFEWHYSKREILEMYLSYLPYGGNIEGVHSASYIFFNRSPKQLSLSQCILLAVIPNRPNSLRLDKSAEETIRFRNKWIQKFKNDKVFEEKNLKAALEEPVGTHRFEMELKTPHLCNYFHATHPETEIYSHIKPNIQQRVQNLLFNHVRRIKGFHVNNGAVLVIDNQTHNVVAYCGSAEFGDSENKGQVNGVMAYRSPGSALKPAVYGLGFDQGIITPKMILPDIPGNFMGYSPDNFDNEFRGLVTVHQALAYSLNLPPVWLLEDVGYEKFADLLEKAGFSDIKKRRKSLGYSLALGGCGVTLEELTRFYTCFANEGKMYDLNYTKAQSEQKQRFTKLFSPAATYIIGNILSDLARPDLPQSYVLDSKVPKIAWKTGTSYGKRDAWAMGYSPRYTVGIWMGNMNGEGSPELSGAVMAVPLLIDIFNTIDYDAQKKWFPKPENVAERTVCSETGMIPTTTCEHSTTDLYIQNVSSLLPCNLYQDLQVSPDGKFQYCPVCLPQSGYITQKYPQYKPEIALWLRGHQVGFPLPPPHNPNCAAMLSGDGPKIISPASHHEYYLEKGNETQLMLQAATEISVSKLHWYINDEFFKTADNDEKVFFTPKPGQLRITCVDDKGRKSEVSVKVVGY